MKKMNMLKTLVAMMAAMTLTLTACGTTTAPSKENESSDQPASQTTSVGSTLASSTEGDTFDIGIVQIVNHPSLNTIRDSFVAKMEDLLGDKVNIESKDAQNDMSNVNSICQKFVGDKKDLIIAIATPTAQAAAAATSEIPIVYSAVSDPEAANLTGIANVTGTSDAIPVESILELAAKLTPQAKTFGFVYNTSEINSVSVIEAAKAYMDANGYQYTEATVTNTGEVMQSASSLVGKVDAIFTPIDNTVATAMPVLAGVGMNNKIPVYVGADSMVADGGLATVGIDYTLLGTRTAEMAADILGGKKPADIPFEVMSNFSTYINKTTADAVGITVPEDLENVVTFE